MLPTRSAVQYQKPSNPNDEKIYSTYQETYSNGLNHGNLVKHYGNAAYLAKESYDYSGKNLKPFLAPSFHNLTTPFFISNRFSDNYFNNYKSSDDNILKRPLRTAPIKTKLDHLFQVKTVAIGQQDDSAVYAQDFLNKRSSDHFLSRKTIKTETINLRDKIACLMELADHMRNKSYDINSRRLFGSDSNNMNHLDNCGQLFSKLIAFSQVLLMAYNKLNLTANELKKMNENFVNANNIIDRNLWDRPLRPDFERDNFNETELSIKKDKLVFAQNKESAEKNLKAAHILLNSIENYVHLNLEEIVEEAKVLLMFKLCKNDYNRIYLRDSNGYIKRDAKLPMNIQELFELTNKGLIKANDLKNKAEEMNKSLIDLINKIGENVSANWLNTHANASAQVEEALKTQSKLSGTQYDLNREINQLNDVIMDTKLKNRTCEMYDEAYLSQLETSLSKIDPNYNENRRRQIIVANNIWSKGNDLKENLNNMIEYNKDLRDRNQRLYRNLYSNHVGVNYDLKTIISPRRDAVMTHPSVNLVTKSLNQTY